MGQINVSLPADGETIDASDYNTPFTTVVNEINGELDNSNIASDAAIAGTKLASSALFDREVNDTAGNEVLQFASSASAVNELTITNAATGNAPSIAATGGDTNIPIRISGKGTGAVQLYVNGVDQLGAWQPWTPSWTNFTVGSATVVARYQQLGKTVNWRILVTLSGSTMGTSARFTLPVTAITTAYSDGDSIIGEGSIRDNGSTLYVAAACLVAGEAALRIDNGSGAFAATTSTSPMTWANGDVISLSGSYEAA